MQGPSWSCPYGIHLDAAHAAPILARHIARVDYLSRLIIARILFSRGLLPFSCTPPRIFGKVCQQRLRVDLLARAFLLQLFRQQEHRQRAQDGLCANRAMRQEHGYFLH